MNNQSKGIPENQQALCAWCSECRSLRSIKIRRGHPGRQGLALLNMDWRQTIYTVYTYLTKCNQTLYSVHRERGTGRHGYNLLPPWPPPVILTKTERMGEGCIELGSHCWF